MAHFPRSCGRGYQVLRSVLGENVFMLLSSINSAYLTSPSLHLREILFIVLVSCISNPHTPQLYRIFQNNLAKLHLPCVCVTISVCLSLSFHIVVCFVPMCSCC